MLRLLWAMDFRFSFVVPRRDIFFRLARNVHFRTKNTNFEGARYEESGEETAFAFTRVKIFSTLFFRLARNVHFETTNSDFEEARYEELGKETVFAFTREKEIVSISFLRKHETVRYFSPFYND